ncbi:hypothetical protein SNL152K_9056 [Streptomyces sp. NL15-2K]|nr:hypothetical protein SNL152K_9056 [Streptomyces sp. NL15-2K]
MYPHREARWSPGGNERAARPPSHRLRVCGRCPGRQRMACQ